METGANENLVQDVYVYLTEKKKKTILRDVLQMLKG